MKKSLPGSLQKESAQDLASALKPFLVLGRLIGVVPYAGTALGSVDELTFRWMSLAAITNCTISCLFAVNMLIGIFGFFKTSGRSIHELALNAHFSVFFGTGLFINIFMILNATDFLRALRKWKYSHFLFQIEDKNLKRDVILITGFVYSSIILENACWHIKHFTIVNKHFENVNVTQNVDSMTDESVFEYFYRESEPQMAVVVPYHPLALVYLFVLNKLCLYSWQFADILIILLSRAIYVKFKLLIQRGKEELFQNGHGHDPHTWHCFIHDFTVLIDLLSAFETIFSPLVFASFGINIYAVCLHLSMNFQVDQNLTTAASVYATWAFLHLIIRFFMVSLSAAKINEHALNVSDLLRKCPSPAYSAEMIRFEKQFLSANIGLKGLGCFTVTKPFILKLLSVIFTVEIVLLQSSIYAQPLQNI